MVKMRNVFPGQPNVGEKMIVHFHQTSGLRATTVVPIKYRPIRPMNRRTAPARAATSNRTRLTRRNLYSRVHGVAPRPNKFRFGIN